MKEIADLKDYEDIIRKLTYFDRLTELPNRELFSELLEKMIQDGKKTVHPIGVLLLDLDRFKDINATLGHPRGDLLIQMVGQRLKQVVRSSDVVARMGGDEFGILFPMTEPGHAGIVAQKILKAFEEHFEIEGLPIVIEGGIGISVYPNHGSDAISLIQKADVAMYASKTTKAAYTLYNPEYDRNSPRRLAMLGELRTGIAKKQLFLHYQPKINLRTGKISGVEALVRWKHPEFGIVPPDQFIPLAEQSGLIKPLTGFILRKALGQSCAWHSQGVDMNVAVNLSVRNLLDHTLPDQITHILSSCTVSVSALNLEITESAAMANWDNTFKTILALSQKGVNFSLDDFGTGHSSLNYLKKLPVNTLKIDKSFVMGMMTNRDDAMIVKSTINLGHNLNLTVVAEGVENKETMDALISFGCDEAQGYYFSRPVLPADLDKLLDHKFI